MVDRRIWMAAVAVLVAGLAFAVYWHNINHNTTLREVNRDGWKVEVIDVRDADGELKERHILANDGRFYYHGIDYYSVVGTGRWDTIMRCDYPSGTACLYDSPDRDDHPELLGESVERNMTDEEIRVTTDTLDYAESL